MTALPSYQFFALPNGPNNEQPEFVNIRLKTVQLYLQLFF